MSTLDPQCLLSLQSNDSALVRRLAFDVTALRRWARRVQKFDDVLVTKTLLSQSARPLRLEIACLVADPIRLRIDRLLASELQLPRSVVQRLERSARIRTLPPGLALRQPVRDGMRLILDVSAIPDRSLVLCNSTSAQGKSGTSE